MYICNIDVFKIAGENNLKKKWQKTATTVHYNVQCAVPSWSQTCATWDLYVCCLLRPQKLSFSIWEITIYGWCAVLAWWYVTTDISLPADRSVLQTLPCNLRSPYEGGFQVLISNAVFLPLCCISSEMMASKQLNAFPLSKKIKMIPGTHAIDISVWIWWQKSHQSSYWTLSLLESYDSNHQEKLCSVLKRHELVLDRDPWLHTLMHAGCMKRI